jgi:hypothetical protein
MTTANQHDSFIKKKNGSGFRRCRLLLQVRSG